MNNLITIAPIAISAIAILISFYQWLNGRGEREANEASTLTGSALDLVRALRTELDGVKLDLANLKNELEESEKAYTAETQRLVSNYERRISAMEKSFEESRDEKDVIIASLTKRVDELEKQVTRMDKEKMEIAKDRDAWMKRALKAEGGGRRV